MRKWFHQWQELNPVLEDGEVGEIIGMLITKTGDGKKSWRELSYTPPLPDPNDTFESRLPDTLTRDVEVEDLLNQKADLVNGTVPDTQISTMIARDSEVSLLLEDKADLVDGIVSIGQLPSYTDTYLSIDPGVGLIEGATKAELDAEAITRGNADTGLDGRVDTLEAVPVAKHGRVTTGSIAGGSSANVIYTLSTPMVNTNYSVVAIVEDSNFDLSVRAIVSRTTTTITVRVMNNSVTTARTGTLHIIAIRD